MTRGSKALGSRGEAYVIVQLLLMLLVLVGPSELPGLSRWDGAWGMAAQVVGLMLEGVGLVLALLGMLSLGRENLSPFPRPTEQARLVTDGPYALVRHPIYSGVGLMAVGWALAWRSPLSLAYAIALVVFFDLKSRREEQWLRARFPEYAAYQRRVKKLIPFLY